MQRFVLAWSWALVFWRRGVLFIAVPRSHGNTLVLAEKRYCAGSAAGRVVWQLAWKSGWWSGSCQWYVGLDGLRLVVYWSSVEFESNRLR